MEYQRINRNVKGYFRNLPIFSTIHLIEISDWENGSFGNNIKWIVQIFVTLVLLE